MMINGFIHFSGKDNFIIYIRTNLCSVYIPYSFNSPVDEGEVKADSMIWPWSLSLCNILTFDSFLVCNYKFYFKCFKEIKYPQWLHSFIFIPALYKESILPFCIIASNINDSHSDWGEISI